MKKPVCFNITTLTIDHSKNTLKIHLKSSSHGKIGMMCISTNVYCNSNADEAWLIFKSKFLSILDKISPLRCVRLKHGTDPWMTGEVIHLIHERNVCLKRFKKTKCNEWYEKYTALRNQVQNKKAVTKSEYFVNKVEESKNQPRKLWQTLKNLGTSSKLKTNSKNVGLKIDKRSLKNVITSFNRCLISAQ